MNRQFKSRVFTLIVILSMLLGVMGVPTQSAQAAGTVSLTAGTTYTENFNTLASSGTSSTLPNGWWFVESGGDSTYAAGTGSSTTGNTYSFGSSGSTERAFGELTSTALSSTIGANFANNTGVTIATLAISYTGEQWRNGDATVADQLDFQYSTNATSLTTGTWTDINALDFISLVTTGTASLDGNASANRTVISYTITGLSIANGSSFWIRWNSPNISGGDDGLAVDDFSLAPNGVLATFQEGISSYAGTVDTHLKQASPTTPLGSDVTVEWDTQATAGDPNTQVFGLLKFDGVFGSGGGQIPVGSTISSATLQYVVSNATADAASSLNEVLVDWTETSTYNSFGATAGVQAEDYGTLVTTVPASSIATFSANVTSSLSAWSGNPSANRGWIIRPTGSDGVAIASSENTTIASRPKLTVLYYPVTGPTITTTGTLSAFSSQPGVASAEQSYSVSGVNLTGDIVITAPADFEISTTSGSGFGSTINLTPAGGTVSATTIYVRFYRATQGISSGDITHTSTDATTRNVAVTGTASNSATVTFQYGVSGYTGTLDTFIRGTTEGNTNFSADTNLEWDDNTGTTTDEIALIRFINIFTSDGGPIPNGATITSASLMYMTTDLNSGSTAFGDPANVYESLVDWPNATVTYNNFGGEAGVQADEYSATPTVSATALALSTQYTIDVTASLQRWSDGTANNYGWIFLPTADDGVNIYSSDFATAANRPRLSVTYATGPVNQAPAQPTLVQPADDATGVSLAPTLEVTVTDPNSNPMDVTFYGRPAGETVGEDFMLVVIPDTQNMATSYPTIFNSMTQWIADNRTTQKIAFATSVGDIVNTASSTTEWTRADAAYDILDASDVPYSVGPGNHDLGGLYNTYFGPSRFIGNGYYQGSYASGQNENNYSFFSAGGMDFILINLQYNSTTAHLDWADALLKANPNRRGIVEQHNILNTDNSWQNQAPYTALKDNPNLFLMLSGHMHTASDGSAYRAELGDDGHTIHILMTDYQDYPNGGNGYLRLLRFSPADNKIYAQVYSPYLGTYLTNTANYEEMEMAYNMSSSAPFELIGTVNNVASGTNASITWPGRAANTEYEWYAVANDGLLSTNSPTWSFTTGTGVDPYMDTSVAHFNAGVVGSCIVDGTVGDGALKLNLPSSSCVFESRIFDGGQGVKWNSLTNTITSPAGTSVSFETRTGNAALPDFSWTPWQTVNSGAVVNPGGQYVQYRATLSTTDTGQTPVLQQVTLGYTNIDFADLIAPSTSLTDWDHAFSWTGVNNATWYYLDVYTQGDVFVYRKWYTAAETNCAGDTSCSFVPAELGSLANGAYKWRLLDYGDSYGYGGWTTFTNFSLNGACYTLTANVSPALGGTLNSTAQNCGGGYTAGTVVQVSLALNEGYVLTGWSGSASGVSNPVSITMDGNKSVTANLRGVTLEDPSGSLSSWNHAYNWIGHADATWYLLLVETSGGSPVFLKWYTADAVGCAGGTDCGVTPVETLGLANGSYRWRVLDYGAYGYGSWTGFTSFTLGTACHTLTTSVLPVGGGTVTTTAQNCAGGYSAGTIVQLTGVPNAGYVFETWSGAAVGSTNPVSVTMDGNKSVTATFRGVKLLTPSGAQGTWNNTFTWTGHAGATWYLLHVVDGSDNNILVRWYTAEQTGCAGGSACAVSPAETLGLATGNYKWRMLDYGAYGYGNWTDFLNFSLP